MSRILIVNEGHSNNLGDKAIKFSLESLLDELGVEHGFMDFTFKSESNINPQNNKENAEKLLLYKTIARIIPPKLKWMIKNIRQIVKIPSLSYDKLIIGGGQLILNINEFPLALFLWCWLFRGSIYIYSVGCGNEFGYINKFLISKSLKKATKIYIRDNNSIKNLEKNFEINAEYCPDVVFTISDTFRHNTFIEKNKGIKIAFANYIDFSIYNNKSKEWYMDYCCNLIRRYNRNSKVSLFYTTLDDMKYATLLVNKYRELYGENLCIDKTNNLEELLEIIIKSEKIVSNRMHALIVAIAFGKEVETIKMSDKIDGFEAEFIKNKIMLQNIKVITREKLYDCINTK